MIPKTKDEPPAYRRRHVQGFQSLSARLPYYRILAVFPERLRQAVDFVRYTVAAASGQNATDPNPLTPPAPGTCGARANDRY